MRPGGVAILTRQTAELPAFRAGGARQLVVERVDVLRPTEPPPNQVFFALTQRADETEATQAITR